MTALLSFRRQVFEGVLSRIGNEGSSLVTLDAVTARLTHATPPSQPLELPNALEGMELCSFELGEPPKLELEVPVRCVNDLLLLFLARRGYREMDEEPLTPAAFAALRSKGLDRTEVPAQLVFRAPAPDKDDHWLELHLDRVGLAVRGLVADNNVIRRVKLSTVVHHDYSKEFVPMLGHAGQVVYVPRQGAVK